MTTKLKIIEFLNENSCLSNDWKEKLLFLIFGDEENVEPVVTSTSSSSEPSSSTSLSSSIAFLYDCMKFIEPHEGKRNHVYDDSRGIPTVGIGFNLKRSDAHEKLEKYGASWHDVMNGKWLEDDVIYKLFKDDVEEFIEKSKRVVTSFDEQPKEIQMVVVDMCFNLGEGGLSKFKNFIAALNYKDYHTAALEMIDSKWYYQVGRRSQELVGIVRKFI